MVEILFGTLTFFGPPPGFSYEGPAEAEVVETATEGEAAPAGEEAPAGEAAPDESAEGSAQGPSAAELAVEAAAEAAKDRAYLERTGREIEVYVEHLDALANVNGELDGCGRAIQAELRMALALAYLKLEGTCSDTGEPRDYEGELSVPVFECFETPTAGECADKLLEHVAEFAAEGNAGTSAPFAQAFGCPHAVAEMSVEQMFGACMVEEYDDAVARWGGGDSDERGETGVWPIPRWASIAGVAGGAALVITGGVLLGINGKCPGGYDPVTEVDQCPSVYNTDVGGGVLLGVGGVAMVGMGVVLGVTEVQRRKRGSSRESALLRRMRRAERLTGFRLLPAHL